MEILALPATAAFGELSDAERFEALMRRHERLVMATALRLLGNLDDAKDAAQEVFLRLYRNRKQVGVSENPAGWLYRVTVNVCHDVRRRGGAAAPVDDAMEVADRAADPQQITVAAERRAMLERGLRVLSEKERAAVVLRDLEGRPTSEVAAILGSSEATVRSQIAKGRIKMKKFLDEYQRRRI
jgi:RNA polymerase sigma-70 factor (ECF subfamily)